MIQVLTLIATTLHCVCGQGFDVRLNYGTQQTTEPGQQMLTVPVFLLSQKRPGSSNFASPGPPSRPSPHLPFGKPPPPSFNFLQPNQNVPRRPAPFHNQQEKFRQNFRNGPFHGSKPYDSFNKPSKQVHYGQPSFTVPQPSPNYLKMTNNYNAPVFHKPVPPINNPNKRPPPSSYQKPAISLHTQYVSVPSSNQRKVPSHSPPPPPPPPPSPQKPYVQTTHYNSYKPSRGYSNPSTSYSITNPSSSTSYTASRPSYPSSSSQSSYSSQLNYPSSSKYNSPSNYVQPSSSYNYASGGSYSPNTYRQNSGYTFSNQISQSPTYTAPEPSTYSVQPSSYESPSKGNQYGPAEVIVTEEVKTSQSSGPDEAEETAEDNASVSYKVIYIPLEVLKNILTNSGLK